MQPALSCLKAALPCADGGKERWRSVLVLDPASRFQAEEGNTMSIGAVTPNLATNGSHLRPEREDMQALQQALRSGDLAGAQQAFTQFKQDFHAAHNGNALYQTGVSDTLKQDLRQLQTALKSGDLAGAQQAFLQFRSDFKSQQAPPKEPPVSNDNDSGAKSTGSINVLA
jgi:TolA-binding protein